MTCQGFYIVNWWCSLDIPRRLSMQAVEGQVAQKQDRHYMWWHHTMWCGDTLKHCSKTLIEVLQFALLWDYFIFFFSLAYFIFHLILFSSFSISNCLQLLLKKVDYISFSYFIRIPQIKFQFEPFQVVQLENYFNISVM